MTHDEFWELHPDEVAERVDAWMWRSALWISVAGSAMGAKISHDDVYRDMKKSGKKMTRSEHEQLAARLESLGVLQ